MGFEKRLPEQRSGIWIRIKVHHARTLLDDKYENISGHECREADTREDGQVRRLQASNLSPLTRVVRMPRTQSQFFTEATREVSPHWGSFQYISISRNLKVSLERLKRPERVRKEHRPDQGAAEPAGRRHGPQVILKLALARYDR